MLENHREEVNERIVKSSTFSGDLIRLLFCLCFCGFISQSFDRNFHGRMKENNGKTIDNNNSFISQSDLLFLLIVLFNPPPYLSPVL